MAGRQADIGPATATCSWLDGWRMCGVEGGDRKKQSGESWGGALTN